jgi:hypothetical protein
LPIGQVFDAEGDHDAIQEIARRARPLIEPMKIASFNINNINRRLPNLLSWLREAGPDIVSLQELKAADTEFPGGRNPAAGYQTVWRGRGALERRGDPRAMGAGGVRRHTFTDAVGRRPPDTFLIVLLGQSSGLRR